MRARDTSATLKVMPRDRETEVPLDATVLVTAPRPLDQLATSRVRVRREECDVAGVAHLSSDGRMLFWRPTQALDPRARHCVTLTGLRDDRGTPFEDTVSTFVTGIFSYLDLEMSAE